MGRDEQTGHDRHLVIANLTGHPLKLIGADRITEIPVEGKARIKSKMTVEYRVHARGVVIPVLDVEEQIVEGLPGRIPGVLYVVSGIVAAAVKDREDVVCPGRVERARNGRVVGCHALVRLTHAS